MHVCDCPVPIPLANSVGNNGYLPHGHGNDNVLRRSGKKRMQTDWTKIYLGNECVDEKNGRQVKLSIV